MRSGFSSIVGSSLAIKFNTQISKLSRQNKNSKICWMKTIFMTKKSQRTCLYCLIMSIDYQRMYKEALREDFVIYSGIILRSALSQHLQRSFSSSILSKLKVVQILSITIKHSLLKNIYSQSKKSSLLMRPRWCNFYSQVPLE